MAKDKKGSSDNLPVVSGMAQLPVAFQEELAADAGQGLELARREDFAIPFLTVLQKLSPQVDKDSDAYVDGAEPGGIYNNVTGELYDGKTGILVIPVHFEKVYNEFVPRDSGGGWRGQFETKEEALENLEAGNEIVDTANHYVLYQSLDGNWQPALVSCTSTKLKVSRGWNAKLSLLVVEGPKGRFRPATFATIWSLTTVIQENQHGKFYNLATEHVGLVQEPALYQAAKDFRTSLAAGRGKVDYDAGQTAEEPTGDSVKEGAGF